MLGDVAQDQVVGDRRGTVKARLPPFALDVILLGEAVSAESIHRRFGGLPCSLRRQVLCHVGFAAARLIGVEERTALSRINEAASTDTCALAIGNCAPWFIPMARSRTL